jgi:hypothetical protein
MDNNITLVNKICLLALLALLTGTADGVFFALIFSLSLSSIALIIKFIYSIKESFFHQKKGEIILWSIGLGLSYLFYSLLPQIFKSQAQHFNYYFILIGALPLVYADLKSKKIRQFIINHTLFLDLMLTVSILRELLGRGSILNYQLFNTPLLTVANSPAGAFIILAAAAFIYEILLKKLNLENTLKKETAALSESEVKA